MCSHPGSAPIINGNSQTFGLAAAPEIHPQKLRKLLGDPEQKKNIVLYCCVERDEPDATNPPIPGSEVMPMGEMVRNCFKDTSFKQFHEGKQYCPAGVRSRMVANELATNGFNIKALQGGSMALTNPTRVPYDYFIILGRGIDQLEQVTMALTMTLSGLRDGNSTALFLIGPAICFALKEDHGESKSLTGAEHEGEPWLPVKKLIDTFVSEGTSG